MSAQVLQLSEQAVQFLKDWFLELEETGETSVSEAKIHARMEETSPERLWSGRQYDTLFIPDAPAGHMTLQGFMSKWHYMMLIDPKTCLKQLLYLGWSNEMIINAVSLSKHRKQERRESVARSVIQCWVFGATGSGKTSFLKASTGSTDGAIDEASEIQEYVAATSVHVPQGDKTLVLMEVAPDRANRSTSKDTDINPFDSVDVAVFLYASNDRRSFVEAQTMMLKVSERAGDDLPCLLIGTKNDLPTAAGTSEAVSMLCEELSMRQPTTISIRNGEIKDVYETIVQAALKPTSDTVPETPARKALRMRRLWTKRLLIAGGVTSAAIVVTVYILPRWKSKSSSDLNVELKNASR